MTVSKDLYLAILALDAYNRGYDPGMVVSGDRIGSARIATDSSIRLGEESTKAAGFYAIAYDDPTYGKIISYRGTHAAPPSPRRCGVLH